MLFRLVWEPNSKLQKTQKCNRTRERQGIHSQRIYQGIRFKSKYFRWELLPGFQKTIKINVDCGETLFVKESIWRALNFLIKFDAAPPFLCRVIKNILKLLLRRAAGRKVLSASGYQHLLLFVAKFAHRRKFQVLALALSHLPLAILFFCPSLFAPGNFTDDDVDDDDSWPLWQAVLLGRGAASCCWLLAPCSLLQSAVCSPWLSSLCVCVRCCPLICRANFV